MRKFKISDRVLVTVGKLEGQTGYIKHTCIVKTSFGYITYYHIELDHSKIIWEFSAHEIKLEERPFVFR